MRIASAINHNAGIHLLWRRWQERLPAARHPFACGRQLARQVPSQHVNTSSQLAVRLFFLSPLPYPEIITSNSASHPGQFVVLPSFWFINLSYRHFVHPFTMTAITILVISCVLGAFAQSTHSISGFHYNGCSSIDISCFGEPVTFPDGCVTPEACQKACEGFQLAALLNEYVVLFICQRFSLTNIGNAAVETTRPPSLLRMRACAIMLARTTPCLAAAATPARQTTPALPMSTKRSHHLSNIPRQMLLPLRHPNLLPQPPPSALSSSLLLGHLPSL